MTEVRYNFPTFDSFKAEVDKYKAMKKSHFQKLAEIPYEERLKTVQAITDGLQSAPWFTSEFMLKVAPPLLETLTNFLLAEDLAKGYMILTRPNKEVGKGRLHVEKPIKGEGAAEFQRMQERGDTDDKPVKICEVCENPFYDKSQNGGSKVCGETCRKYKDAMRQRKRKYKDERLKGERERRQLEYGFFAPYELTQISRYEKALSEQKLEYEQSKKIRYSIINGRVASKELPPYDEDKNDDPEDIDHSQSKWGEVWVTNKELKGESGPVLTYNLRDFEFETEDLDTLEKIVI